MPPLFQAISDLQPGLSRIALQLRLIRRYILPSFQNNGEVFSSESIYHDRSGNRIHASIPKGLISKFEMFMEDGKLYAIKNFVVANNFIRYKTTNNAIGVIVSTNIPQGKEVNGKSTKLMDFIIEDLEKKTLSCTLWDSHADQLYNFLIKYPEDPVIVILQYCRPTAYKGEIKVTNAYHATKVIFDENMTEIKEFKEEFEKGGKTTPTSITDLTLVDATKRTDNNNDFETEFKTLSHLQTDGKVKFRMKCSSTNAAQMQ
ncbi:hypothetical protein C2S52_021187 [Perilla frutescens var. hirtella]|nr:hypothetical protein C2S52_021187 [Perilla frutescens var. hirtella]KAH6808153.1 hypothetical protein C2S51_029261 [Perilla frutescens var. frutescens]